MSLHPEKNYFKDYPNGTFVETGSYRGDAIQSAMDAGFKRIYSMDIDIENIEFCKHRFDLYRHPTPRISLTVGNSALHLCEFIKRIDEPITFWLDAHWQMFENEDPGTNPFPLLDEIEQIGMHHLKNHTIIIDDMLIMQWDIVGYDKGLIQTRIEKINPNYKFKFLANPIINGIMVAYV